MRSDGPQGSLFERLRCMPATKAFPAGASRRCGVIRVCSRREDRWTIVIFGSARSALSRRGFLGGAAAAAVTAILAACGGSSATDTPKAAAATTAATAATAARLPRRPRATKAPAATTASGSAAAGGRCDDRERQRRERRGRSGNPTKKTGDPNAKYAGPTIEKGGTLKVLMWAHYVPAYDTDYFDKWATDWGTKNGLKVTVDHVPTNTVVTKASADIAIKGGHDLTQLQDATDAAPLRGEPGRCLRGRELPR